MGWQIIFQDDLLGGQGSWIFDETRPATGSTLTCDGSGFLIESNSPNQPSNGFQVAAAQHALTFSPTAIGWRVTATYERVTPDDTHVKNQINSEVECVTQTTPGTWQYSPILRTIWMRDPQFYPNGAIFGPTSPHDPWPLSVGQTVSLRAESYWDGSTTFNNCYADGILQGSFEPGGGGYNAVIIPDAVSLANGYQQSANINIASRFRDVVVEEYVNPASGIDLSQIRFRSHQYSVEE